MRQDGTCELTGGRRRSPCGWVHPLKSIVRAVSVTAIVLGILCYAARAQGPSTSGEEATGKTTEESLETLVQQVDNAELEAEPRGRIVETISLARGELERAATLARLATEHKERVAAAEEEAVRWSADAESPDPPDVSDVSEWATLAELEAAVAKRRPLLEDAKTRLAGVEGEVARRSERRQLLLSALATLSSRQSELEEQLRSPPPDDEIPLATAARMALVDAKLQALAQEPVAYRAELARYDAEKAVNLLAAQGEVARRRVTRITEEIATLEKRVDAERKREAATHAATLRDFAERIEQPRLRKYAMETARLASTNEELADSIARANREATAARTRLETLQQNESRLREKVSRVGLTGAIGLELRKQLQSLSATTRFERRAVPRQTRMREAEFLRLQYEDQIREISDDDGSGGIVSQLRRNRREILAALVKNYHDLFDKLSDVDSTERQLVEATAAYRSYIREHVLWVRSDGFLSVADVRTAQRQLVEFLDGSRWLTVARTIYDDASEHLVVSALMIVCVVVLVLLQHRCRRQLEALGVQAERSTFSQFLPTVRAAYLTFVISVLWPVVFGYFGWRLTVRATDPFAFAVGRGLLAVALAFLELNMLRQACRTDGLCESHFNWSSQLISPLRRSLYRLMVAVLPLGFVAVALHTDHGTSGRDSLERLCSIAVFLLYAVFLQRQLRPTRGVFRQYFARRTDSWVYRLRWLWFPIGFGLPLFLALLATAGYFYTAYELSWRFSAMVWLIVGLIFVRAFLFRWFTVSHRRLRIEQARQRRQMLRDQSEASPASLPHPVPDDEEAELQVIGDQTQRLINTGLALTACITTWMLWIEVLPALRILDRWELWYTSVEQSQVTAGPDGELVHHTETVTKPITAGSIVMAVVLAVVTFTASRNLPGLLEIVLLQRLPLEPAVRYAVRMVTRYVILSIGIVVTFGSLGIGWSKVQWLVAALTVGLGFGLQEIFANFISGLIILFERPVRIGDVATIDGVTGVVSRIQMRATTITDWDRKEYIVPNKEFVTGRLLNWTLTDTTNRIVINVGVAYGTDSRQARDLLVKVASDNENVLREPAPVATFEGFADSTLSLVLRCYLPDLSMRLSTVTALHEAIDREFQAAGIEIAFPQRDINIRALPDGLSLGN